MAKNEEKKKRPFLSKLLFLILIVILLLIYARYVGPKGLKVSEYSITSGDLPESFDGFSIVHFSDLKFGSTIFLEDVENIVQKINDLKPDIVVFTGDLVGDEYKISKNEQDSLIEELKKIDPLIFKYAVRGDMDYKGAIYDEIIENADFIDLTNSNELIYFKGLTPIAMYGLGSLIKDKQDYKMAFNLIKTEDLYSILLVHEPDTLDYIGGYDVDLVLAGHYLNGSINIPYVKNLYNIKGASKYILGEYDVNGTKLYTSNGLGTNKLKLRLFNKPSISIYRLYKK